MNKIKLFKKKNKNPFDFKYSKFKSVLHYFRTKKKAPSGLVIYFGNRGSGKSTECAKHYYHWVKHDYRLYGEFYTNVPINTTNPHYHYLDLNMYQLTDYLNPQDELIKKYKVYTNPQSRGLKDTPFKILPNSIIEIDELGIIAHNRNYANFPKEFTSFIKLLRKYGIFFVANSQNYDIDKTLRNGASALYLKRKILHLSVSRKINKKIVCSKNENGSYKNADEQIHDELSFAVPIFPSSWKITFIPFYTDLFDSYM